MELVIHFNSITNSYEISNSFQFNYKLKSSLRIVSNWITKVIENADLFLKMTKNVYKKSQTIFLTIKKKTLNIMNIQSPATLDTLIIFLLFISIMSSKCESLLSLEAKDAFRIQRTTLRQWKNYGLFDHA